ncbi:MAG: hypothetical protein ACUVWX_12800 [Kiritimatiellia bacterium]
MGVAAALITIIPLLALLYLSVTESNEEGTILTRHPYVCLLLILIATLGYTLLIRYPATFVRLRRYLEEMVGGKLPDRVVLLKDMDDVSAIERSLNLLLEQMRNRLTRMENELSKIE